MDLPGNLIWTRRKRFLQKLDPLILDKLHLRDRVKDEQVCIKLHVGNTVGYSTVHPVFVRKVSSGHQGRRWQTLHC